MNVAVQRLDDLLAEAGVRHFKARELLRCAKPHVAADLGVPLEDGCFQPSTSLLPRLVSVAVLAERLRAAHGGPLVVRSGYRPRKYNDSKAIKGSPTGQHPHARALDLHPKDGNIKRLRRITFDLWAKGEIDGAGFYLGNVHIDNRTTGGRPRRAWGSRLATVVIPWMREHGGIPARMFEEFGEDEQQGLRALGLKPIAEKPSA